MDCFDQSTGFRYNSSSGTMSDEDGDSEFSGILEICVYHARNIHNICIYDNQDVYAKFSLTYNPDETISTRIINGGGKNPEFNESLMMKVAQRDSVLKCEIWMLSRARNYMEDQLLGFALVPVSQFIGKGKVTEDYSLTSTDLFHSPAGSVRLSLSLKNASLPVNPSPLTIPSISSEVTLLDRKTSEINLDPVEYSRIEFPDMNVVEENQQMISEYFGGLGSRPCAILCLGASSQSTVDDCEMIMYSSEENQCGSSSPGDSSLQTSGFLNSTTTSLSDDRNTVDSIEKKKLLVSSQSSTKHDTCETPTSKKELENASHKEDKIINSDKGNDNANKTRPVKYSQVFSAPMGSMNSEAEQSAMQQQIVDMYMRSMQQFTESLAKMKLPMDLDKPEREEHIQNNNSGNTKQDPDTNNNNNKKNKKDGTRVFYGSRAFF